MQKKEAPRQLMRALSVGTSLLIVIEERFQALFATRHRTMLSEQIDKSTWNRFLATSFLPNFENAPFFHEIPQPIHAAA